MNAGQRPLIRVRRSRVHGKGVFAARRIGKGTRVIEYLGERITHAEAGERYYAAAEPDAFVLLAQQVEDEANHYEYSMRALARRGVTSLDNWKPEPEWEEWIDVWYPSGADTIERVAAHNLTGEYGACQAFLEIKPRLPVDVQKTFDRIIPDEQFHMKLGRQVIERYCTNEDAVERVRARVLHTFELEQAGRMAYNRRMAAIGVADLTDPTPPLS